jgi:outer membrane immunogenic protein
MKILTTAIIALAFLSGEAKADPNWSGPYVGASIGGLWGDASTTDTTGGVKPGPFNYNPTGFVGGGLAGYNLQYRSAVFGLEANLGYMDLQADKRLASSNPYAHQDITIDGGLYGDVTARAGLLVMPGTLVYAKGGFAFFDGSVQQTTTNPGYVSHSTGMFTGWTAGAGVEHYIQDNVSLKIEYQHFDFGSEGGDQTSVSDDPVGYVYKNKTDLTVDSVKAALVYHF